MLSLDVGRRRIGLAGCDGLGITVNPLPALPRSAFEQDLKHLEHVCLTRRAKGLVVGLPLMQMAYLPSKLSIVSAMASDWRWL